MAGVRSAGASRIVLSALLATTMLAAMPRPAAAQQRSDIDELRQEMQQMRQQYDAMLQQMRASYETRLREMDARLKAAEDKADQAAAPPPSAPPPALASTAAPPMSAQMAAPGPAVAPPAPGGLQPLPAPAGGTVGYTANPGAFNPSIGVILDGRFAAFSKDPGTYRLPGFARGSDANPGDRGFALGETEISVSSNIDQDLYGAAIVSITRTGTVSVEEAYLQTTTLPYSLTAKAGRFFSGIGYLNEQHRHVWDFADAPLPYRAFLNDQFGDDGVQLRWLAPTDFFLEFGTEAARGDAFPAGNAANRGVGAYSGFFHVGDDLNESSSFRTGLSLLHTKASNRVTGSDTFSGDSNTGIFDFVYKWAPEGNPTETNFKLQGEYFLRRERGTFNALDYAGWQNGWYTQAVYQFMPRWRVGLRYDQVYAQSPGSAFSGTTLDNLGDTPRRYSAMTDYSTSEFGRFRLQYNRDLSRPQVDNEVILQYTVSLGAHGAHAF
jgi:hypothetical protein